MKWFQHWTDSHTNKKGRKILRNQGLQGYAIWWICREMVGKEGKNYRLSASDEWKKTLKDIISTSQVLKKSQNHRQVYDDQWPEKILEYQAEIGAINRNALKKGDLYIPKMREYSDDYTKRVRREFGQSSVRLDKIRLDKIIQDYIRIKGYPTDDKELVSQMYQRYGKAAKSLCLIAKDKALEALRQLSEQLGDKGLEWNLDTIVKWLPKFFASQHISQAQDKRGQETKDKLEKMRQAAEDHPIDPKALDKLMEEIG